MVVLHDVHKSFGKTHAVRGVSFELRSGQVAGLLGPNGAGKTTTIRMIAGYFLPDRGSVSIGGFDTQDKPTAARRRVGYLPESNPLYPEMRVGEYLEYRVGLFGIAREFRARAVGYAIERCWLRDVARARIGTLSKGYRQRVGLAGALVHNPPVLILDEPTNGLDPTQIRESRDLIRELAGDRCMLVCTHILSEAERIADRILVIAQGSLKADGTPAELTRAAGGDFIVQTREARLGESERLMRLWQSLPHVTGVTSRSVRDPGPTGATWTEWTITVNPGAPDIREHIWNAATGAGVMVRELRAALPSLEAVFASLLDPPAPAPPAPAPAPAPAKEAAA
ncbi:MAG: ABC transporter ATP-binding protein [Planctomycetota bacterium]|nr:ABC transporter ATP-binding protein [Planctomycetota bacterium]